MSNYRYISKDRHLRDILQQIGVPENLIHNNLGRHIDHRHIFLHLHQHLYKCGVIVVLSHLYKRINEFAVSISIRITDAFDMSHFF
jgi:hypothetical protein